MLKPSATQLMLLRRLAGLPRDRQLVTRWPGGFWAPLGTPAAAHVRNGRGLSQAVPSYWVGTATIRAMERAGWLKEDLSESAPEWARRRKLTTDGRQLGEIAGWSGEGQE